MLIYGTIKQLVFLLDYKTVIFLHFVINVCCLLKYNVMKCKTHHVYDLCFECFVAHDFGFNGEKQLFCSPILFKSSCPFLVCLGCVA